MKKLKVVIFCIISFNLAIVSSESGSKNLAPFYVARELEEVSLNNNTLQRKKDVILSLRIDSKDQKKSEIKPKEHETPFSLEAKKEESLTSFLDIAISDNSSEKFSENFLENEEIDNESLEEFLELLEKDMAILKKRIISFKGLFKHKK